MRPDSRHPWPSRLAFLPLLLGIAWVCFCLSSAMLLDPARAFKLTYLLALILAVLKPVWAIGLFLVFMPWIGGSQPGDAHTLRFLLLLSGLSLGTVINSIWGILVRGQGFFIPWQNPLVFAVLLYWVVTALTLTGVHPNPILWALGSFNPPLARDFLGYDEGFEIYPWVSFVTLSMSLWLFIYLINLFRARPELRASMLQCLGLGALLTVSAGILDYFDVVDLVFFRPIGAATFRFERLTSTFGNPTWYAQYLTLCAPAILSALLVRWRASIALSFMLIVMVLAEFCIILINQRGGWLAYPLTLIVVWFCVYVLNTEQTVSRQLLQSLKRSWVKIALTLPVTILVSLSLIYAVAGSQSAGKQQVLGFVERAKTINNTHDRLAFLEPTVKLFQLHPVFGGGVDAFRHQYEKAFMVDGHLCELDDHWTMGARGSAHNLYFQTLVGKGFVGLLSLLGLMFAAIFLCWRGVFSLNETKALQVTREQRITMMCGFAFTMALAVYGNVGEIFYTPVNYVVFVLFYAVTASAGNNLVSISLRYRWGIVLMLSALLGLHLYLERFGNLSC